MRLMLIGLGVVLLCGDAAAVNRHYRPNGALTQNVDSSSNYASLEEAQAAESWQSADDVLLDPGTYNSGGLTLVNEVTLRSPGGATLQYAVPNGTTSGVLVTQAAAKVIGPMRLEDTSTNGSGGKAILAMCGTGDVVGLVLEDIDVGRCPAVGGYGPIELRQNADPPHIMRATLTRVTCELDGDYRDVFVTSRGPIDGRRGRFTFRGCRAANATSTAGSGGGTSNGCYSCDAAADHEFYDCDGKRAGGSIFEQVSSTAAMVHCFGCTGEDDQLRSTETSRSWAVFSCEQTYNCFSARCAVGHRVEGSLAAPGFGVSRGGCFIRDPARTDLHSFMSVGIYVTTPQTTIGPVWVEGWRNAESGSTAEAAICLGASAGFSCRIEDAMLVDCFRGIDCRVGAGSLDLERVLIEGHPVPSGTLKPAALIAEGSGANALLNLRLANSLIDWEPTGDVTTNAWYAIAAVHVTEDATGGYSYVYSRPGVVVGNGVSGWSGQPTDDVNTDRAPQLDQDFRQLPESPTVETARLNRYLGDFGAVDPNSGHFDPDPRGYPDATAQGAWTSALSDTGGVTDVVGPLIISRDGTGSATDYRFEVSAQTNPAGVASLWLKLDSSTNGTNWSNEAAFDLSSNGYDTIGELRQAVDAVANWTANAPWGPQHRCEALARQGPTSAAVNDTGVLHARDNYFREKTLLCLTGRLAPQFRRVTDFDAANGAITVSPEFADPPWDADTSSAANTPQTGDRFAILPRMVPSAGNLSNLSEFHLELQPTHDGLPLDASGRIGFPGAKLTATAVRRDGRVAPGPFFTLPSLSSALYRPDGLSGDRKLMRWDDVMARRRAGTRR